MKARTGFFALAFALLGGLTSCQKDKITPDPIRVVVPTPPDVPTIERVTLSNTDRIDLDLIAYSTLGPDVPYELSISGSPLESFTINRETRKLWNLGKKDPGVYRINMHVGTSRVFSSGSCFLRYNISNGSVTHSVSPTPLVGNNYAFDLIIER